MCLCKVLWLRGWLGPCRYINCQFHRGYLKLHKPYYSGWDIQKHVLMYMVAIYRNTLLCNVKYLDKSTIKYIDN